MKFVIFIISFILLSTTAYSQLNFEYLGKQQELLEKEVFKIITTTNGKIWLATAEGIIAYNGHSFVNYNHSLNDSNTLSNNYCKNMAVDGNDNLWVVADDFLNVFDTKSKKVTRINEAFKNDGKEKLKITPTCFYYSKKAGIMFVGTKSGLFFSSKGIIQIDPISKLDQQFNFTMEISGISFDENSNTLFFISKNILHCVNLTSKAYTQIILNETIVNKKLNPNEFFLSAFYVDANTIWIGLYGNGLLELNRNTKQSILHTNSIAGANDITTITQFDDPIDDSKLYLSTHGSGVVMFDINTRKFSNNIFNKEKSNQNLNQFYCAYKSIWFAGKNGLSKIEINKQQFDVYDFKPKNTTSIIVKPNKVQVERNDRKVDEILWVLVHYVGAYRYNIKTKSIIEIPKLAKQFFVHEAGILDYLIDKNNYLWISSVKDGITCYDINNDKIIFTNKAISKTNKNWVYSFHEDFRGNIWFATPSGVCKFNKATKNIDNETAINNFLLEHKLSLYIEGITSNENGNIWISVDGSDTEKGAGIIKYNTEKQTTELLFSELKNIPITNAPIFLRNLAVTKNNELYALIRGYGWLYFKSANELQFEYITKNNSSISDLYSDYIISDNTNKVWSANSNVLYYYNQENKDFVNVLFETGVNGKKNISTIDKSNNTDAIIISSENSFIFINPKNAIQGISKANLIFEQFYVFDKIYNLQLQTGETIKLLHSQNTISINFALLNYTNSELNKYYWKLSGVNQDWQSSNNNIASYNLLPPGKYIFEVKATDNNGLWAPQQLKLIIIIKPPFYKTWWFVSLMSIMALATVYFLYKQRLNKLKNKYALQNKIAADLHDEVGSTLTSISILSKLSQNIFDTKPEQVKEMLTKINTQSTTVQQNISDIVWSIRADNKNGESLITRFREYASTTLEPLNIIADFELDSNLLDRDFSVAYKKELLLIFKESINNIVKHANATKVIIRFLQQENQNMLSIQDDGIWQGHNSGTGSKTILERAKAIGGSASIMQNEIGTIVVVKF